MEIPRPSEDDKAYFRSLLPEVKKPRKGSS